MTILKKRLNTGRMTIDLTGPEGNAYCLLAYAKRIARQLNLDGDAITTEMKTGDYENLVQVFDNHFGNYVILLKD
jgi:hypothetical protein